MVLRNPSSDAVYFEESRCIKETPKAILVRVYVKGQTNRREVWVPKSVLHDDSEIVGKGDEGTLAVQEWWVEKEQLEPQ